MKQFKITFRADENLKDFLNNFARDNKMERSEMIRRMIVSFQMRFLLGELKKPFPELKDSFLKKFGKKKLRKKFIKKYDKDLLKDIIG